MPTFAEGFSQGKADKQNREQKKELMDLQVKAFKSNLELQEKKKEAQEKFQSLFGPSSAPQGGMEGPPQKPQPGKSFIELLSDPEGQMSGLMSGMISSKDIGIAQQRQLTQQILKSLGGGQLKGVDPVSATIAGVTGDLSKLQPEDIVTKTIETPEGPRIKTFSQRTGREVADIGAAKADKVTPEQAGRTMAAVTAEQNAFAVRQAIEGTSGMDRRALLTTMAMAVPGTKGRELRFKMADAADAVVRLRTGATANETELKQILEQFMPSPLDSDEGIQDKMNRFEKFISGTLEAVTLPPTLKKKIEKQRPKKKPALDMGKSKVIDFSELPE